MSPLTVRNLSDWGGSVALSEDVAKGLGLPDGSKTVEDPSKMIYQIAGYHQLHCLVRLLATELGQMTS